MIEAGRAALRAMSVPRFVGLLGLQGISAHVEKEVNSLPQEDSVSHRTALHQQYIGELKSHKGDLDHHGHADNIKKCTNYNLKPVLFIHKTIRRIATLETKVQMELFDKHGMLCKCSANDSAV